MTATPDYHDGESFRISYHGFHVGYARSVPELKRWVELTNLEEALRRQRTNLSAVAGSCRGWKYTDPQPGSRHRISRWPLPRGCAFRAGSHWQAATTQAPAQVPRDARSRTRPGRSTSVVCARPSAD
jgi:hypothetical protein